MTTIENAAYTPKISEDKSQDNLFDELELLNSADQKVMAATARLKKAYQDRIDRSTKKMKDSIEKERELTERGVTAKQNIGNSHLVTGSSNIAKMLQDQGLTHSIRGLMSSDNSPAARRAFDSSALGLAIQAASSVSTTYADKTRTTHEAEDAKLQMESGQERERATAKREAKQERQAAVDDVKTVQSDVLQKIASDSRSINNL
ncbi:MAG: hypothetical protein GWP59_07130 [Chlamydiales bacterium]|nr:hypothetical protein [Chlamydiales bacterium]NCF71457.1 hypothetical protein [Chlamydiales bacterium]